MVMATSREFRIISILALLSLVGFLLVLPTALSAYYMRVMVMLWIYVILAISFNLTFGYLGLFSFGFTTFYGLGGYFTGYLTARMHWNVGLGLVAALGIGGVSAFIIGFPSLRLKGHYFVLITLAFLGIISSLPNNLLDLTGGSSGLRGIPAPSFLGIDFADTRSFYFMAFALVIITTILVFWLVESRVGRAFVAVRDNEELANSLGINPFRYKMIGFVIAGMIGGGAGWLYAHFIGAVDPGMFGFTTLFNATFIVILGGTGTLPGPIIGSFVVVFLPEVLRMDMAWRMFSTGAFMLAVVVLMPNGAYPFFKQRVMRFDRWRKGGQPTFNAAGASVQGKLAADQPDPAKDAETS